MFITGQNIINKKLMKKLDKKCLLGSSYLLRIHSILPAGDACDTLDHENLPNHLTIQPGGIAWIITKEVFNISDTSITGIISLRSEYTKKGLLALDVGTVDANYFGPIGSVVINFSNKKIRLSKEDKIFRVMFAKHENIDEEFCFKEKTFGHEEYIKDILDNQVSAFSSSFLQIDEIKKQLFEDMQTKIKDELIEQFVITIGNS